MMLPVPVDVDALRLSALSGVGGYSVFLRNKRGNDALLQLRADAVDVADHLPDIPTVELRRVKAVPLRDQRPLHALMGAVQGDHKIFPISIPGQRLEAGIVIQRPRQRAVVLKPDVVIVQDKGVGDAHNHPAYLLQPSRQSMVLAKPVIPASPALCVSVLEAKSPGPELLLPLADRQLIRHRRHLPAAAFPECRR